jgi:hypothetical protein
VAFRPSYENTSKMGEWNGITSVGYCYGIVVPR